MKIKSKKETQFIKLCTFMRKGRKDRVKKKTKY